MCRAISVEDRSSDDETNDHLYNEDEVFVIHKPQSVCKLTLLVLLQDAGELQYHHQLKKSMIIDYIMSLGGNQKDPFVSPVMALKIIDFCFLIVNRTNITKKVNTRVTSIVLYSFHFFHQDAEQLVRRWFRVNAGEQVIVTFHHRVKSMDEIMEYLIEVNIVFAILYMFFYLTLKDLQLKTILID